MKKRLFFILLLTVMLCSLIACTDGSSDVNLNGKPNQGLNNACEHTFSDWTVKKEPSCAENGHRERVCSICGFTDIEYLARLPHSEKAAETVEPTCEEEGYTLYACECGYSYKSDFTAPMGHSLTEEKIIPDDCTSPAYTHVSCSECEFEYDTDFLPREHSLSSKTVLPLTTQNGYTEHTCDVCKFSYISSVTKYSDICASPYGEFAEPLHKGLDLSIYNHATNASDEYLPIDFESIKNQGYDFVILKIGSSRSGKSPVFEEDYAGAKAAGLEVGVYYYTYSKTARENESDALDVVKWLEGKQLEYPIYYDLEDPTLENLTQAEHTRNITCFIETLQANGYYGALYVNHNWLYNILDTAKIISMFDIWIANWTELENPSWSDIYTTSPLAMWQVTDSKKVEGLEGNQGLADLNFCYRDYSKIMKRWGLNGFEKEDIQLGEKKG